MAGPITSAEIDAAVRLAGARRSDFDLNPEIKGESLAGRALRPAAVLCALRYGQEGLEVILTKRPDTMKEHAGQIAFPGGKVDAGDDGPVDAALREAEEEIGLPRTAATVLGQIDPYITGTGFEITPVVALIAPGTPLIPDPHEVEEAFTVPLDFLMNPAHLRRHSGTWGGRKRLYYAIPWQERYIWGATAGILKSLADRIAAARVP